MPSLTLFLGEGSPTKIDYRTKGTLILRERDAVSVRCVSLFEWKLELNYVCIMCIQMSAEL